MDLNFRINNEVFLPNQGFWKVCCTDSDCCISTDDFWNEQVIFIAGIPIWGSHIHVHTNEIS